MPVEDVNQRMLQSAQTMFPAVRHQGRIVPWQAPEVANSVRGMWQAYRVWRQGARLGKRGLCSLTQFRHRTKQAKGLVPGTGSVHGVASSAGDVRALFRLAGALMPKQPKQRLQLRGPQREIWSPERQVACLKTFFQDLYSPHDEPTLPPLPAQITVEEVTIRLGKLPVHKATPSHLAPTAASIACADILAPWLSDKVNNLTKFPAIWSAENR